MQCHQSCLVIAAQQQQQQQHHCKILFFLVTTPKNIWFDHVLELDLRWDDEHLEACLATSDHVELIIRQLQGLVNPHLGQDDQN